MSQPPDNAEQPYVTVEIYDQAYHLSGPDPAQVKRLAALVDARMRAVASRGRTADSLRVAVLAALNLADELTRAEDRLRAAEGSAGSEGLSSSEDSASLRADLQIRAANLRGLLDTVLEEDAPAGS
jgi:cell division protein ZapA